MDKKNRSWATLTPRQQAQDKPTAGPDQEILDKIRYLQNRFLSSAELGNLLQLEPIRRRREIEKILNQIIENDGFLLTPHQYAQCVNYILNEALGYGPLSGLIGDPSVSEIMVNGPEQIFVERRGKIEPVTDVAFQGEGHLRTVIDRIVGGVGRRVDESNPSVDARLDDGSRVNVLIPPLSLDGPILTIRKFQQQPFSLDDLVALGMLRQDMADFLKVAVQAKLNIMVSGGAGAGKTTILNALAGYIEHSDRIVTVEDSAELKFHQQHPHVVRAETRPANVEGTGEVTIRDLVRNALRMRPNRIVIGEVRGAEAWDMLQAMNTGHAGSMTTIHANSAEDTIRRLETLVRMAEGAATLPNDAVREQIVSAVDLIVQVSRYGNERKIASISEIQDIRHGNIVVKDIFRFDVLSTDPTTRKVQGRFDATGVIPTELPRLEARGAQTLSHLFKSSHVEEEIGAYLSDDNITEIMINGIKDAYVERRGEGLKPVPIEFPSEAHLLSVINSIIAPLGRRLDKIHPMVDARLPDGSRVNAVIRPISQIGPILTIRRFPKTPLKMEDLVRGGSLTQNMSDFLEACVNARLNILVSGGTGTGKTTLLNALAGFIDNHHQNQRLITIEDIAELRLQHDHWIRLESRPVDDYGEGEVTIRDLVTNSLRMRPDRIIVGETRGPEALDMLQAMNTGHEGSMTTIHANSPQDAVSRLETLVMLAGTELPLSAVQAQIIGALDIIVQINRMANSKRKVTSIAEVIKDRSHLEVREIFRYQASDFSSEWADQGLGKHYCLSSTPACLDRLKFQGIQVAPSLFAPLWEGKNNI